MCASGSRSPNRSPRRQLSRPVEMAAEVRSPASSDSGRDACRRDSMSRRKVATERPMATQTRANRQGLHTPARVVLVIDQPVLAEVVKLALNHGVFIPRVVRSVPEARDLLHTWQPHLAVTDMDICGGQLMDELGSAAPETHRIPVIGLTRRGDLKTTLAAFEWGVDDLLTVPFSPEEL